MTKSGKRCSRLALHNGFCKQHSSCNSTTLFGDDSVRERVREAARRVREIEAHASSLEDEREFYYRKLVKVEEFAESLPPQKRAALKRILLK